MNIKLTKSNKDKKKYMVVVDGKTIHFGQEGASDFTINKDPERKKRYIVRHKKRENWNKSGIKTAGFWAKHILWNKDTIDASKKNTEKTFKIKIL